MAEYEIKQTLMERDGISAEEADETIEAMCEELDMGEDIGDILYNQGLELDYAESLIEAWAMKRPKEESASNDPKRV